MKLSNRQYDAIKWVATILLPAVNTLWLTLGQVWCFPHLEQIGATIAGIDVFIGALVGLSNRQFVKEGSEQEEVLFTDSESEV